MSKFWFGTSWKMNGSKALVTSFVEAFSRFDWQAVPDMVPFVLPPFPYVESLANGLEDTPVRVGVQNIGWMSSGALTGEVSPHMAAEIGATLAEIGHAERRALFGETDETVRDKVRFALEAELTPLICVGDLEWSGNVGDAIGVIVQQAHAALSAADGMVDRCVLAYEPVWSIGEKGVPAEPARVGATLRALRSALAQQFGPAGTDVPILYGGSVNAANVAALAATPGVDGLFLGRGGWRAKSFLDLLGEASRAKSA
ncbi:MAG: triose-phosphate isomerase [Bauldia sp.]|nr:triose-phosphate isomerase [Bauldia sp.]